MKALAILGASLLLTACSATTHMKSFGGSTIIKVNDDAPVQITGSDQIKYATTSFGQYKFKAEQDGSEPMYGLLPLKFNGGYLAADILFFAPAMLFNLREVYPYYEFDVLVGVVRYKKHESDPWMEYKPKAVEVQHAKTYFKE